MNNQPLVGVVDGVAHGHEQIEADIEIELPAIAIGRDRLALDVLHRKIRTTVVRHAAVDELA